MKKLTLTFCALTALFAVAPAIYADGPESVSSKEKNVMQPAPPVCDLYRAHEWDLDIWGAFAFAADTGNFDVPNDDPFTPDVDVINQTFISIFGIPIIGPFNITEPRLGDIEWANDRNAKNADKGLVNNIDVGCERIIVRHIEVASVGRKRECAPNIEVPFVRAIEIAHRRCRLHHIFFFAGNTFRPVGVNGRRHCEECG